MAKLILEEVPLLSLYKGKIHPGGGSDAEMCADVQPGLEGPNC